MSLGRGKSDLALVGDGGNGVSWFGTAGQKTPLKPMTIRQCRPTSRDDNNGVSV